MHKRVCSDDPLLRPFIDIEMACERALAKRPMIQAPKEAMCYICLEGGDSGKLMRGCACRGDSAGFVHIECLTKLAMSKEASGDNRAVFYSFIRCINCHQDFQDALELEMTRRFWRRYRGGQNQELLHRSAIIMAYCLESSGEFHSGNRVYEEASKYLGSSKSFRCQMNIHRARMLKKNGKKLEALELAKTTLSELNGTSMNSDLYCQTSDLILRVLLDLDRNQEAQERAAELRDACKVIHGPEDPTTLEAMKNYAVAGVKLGRVEESKKILEDVLNAETRICGPDHALTQKTKESMRTFGFLAEPAG